MTTALVADDLTPLPDRYSEGELVAKKYVLVRRLGRGGMGEVWLAKNRALDAQVAIKLISRQLHQDAAQQKALAQRLLEEARSTAQLQHSAIVRVFDFGITSMGDPMIVMEYLEGQDLHAAIGEVGRPSPLRAVRIILPLIHGLASVHAKGVVHRDIKPENIFLCQTEGGQVQPKLVDFGIAKREARRSSRLTVAGSLMGSPGYMSPEQAVGDEAGVSSDIWSICVVLYEMVTGNLPFASDDLGTQLARIVNEPPEPISGVPGAEGLWPIIERGLRKVPSSRYQSMQELGLALADWASEHGATADITGASFQATWHSSGPMSAANALLSIPPPRPDPLGSAPAPVAPGPSAAVPMTGAHPVAPSAAELDVDPLVRAMVRDARIRMFAIFVVVMVFALGLAATVVLSTI
jgi:eukaryotic-like serine/threonine-protein kinase